MYCPKCLNDTLSLCNHGVVNIKINGKQMDAGRFLFSLDRQSHQEIVTEFSRKLEEFFKWYSSFKNKDPIQSIEITSSDFACTNGCRLDYGWKSSIIEVLISEKEMEQVLRDFGNKYRITIDLN